MQSAELDESQPEIKIAERNIKNLRYTDDTTLIAENEEDLKSLLMRVEKESEKAGLKLNIQKTKNMAPSAITSWQVEGKNWKQWQIFFFFFLPKAPKSLQMMNVAMKFKDASSLEGKLWQT